jgi:peroxiredoxin
MVRTETPAPAPGAAAPDFALLDPAGTLWRLADVRGPHGTLVMFICNHCPYVQAIAERLADTAPRLRALGVGVAAIMPNDVAAYPEDAPPRMAAFAARHGFDFPYLYDETQAVARAYGAVCTPDFFGYDRQLRLAYRGRLVEGGKHPPPGAREELYDAMAAIARGQPAPAGQWPSIGCSIKWRED